MTIKNIIFDLGGVIINIDYKLTSEAFTKLGASDFDKIYTQNQHDPLFDDYETGKISSKSFRDLLKQKLNIAVTDEVFDRAWNAMLLDLPLERLDFIKKLRKTYKVFLFSNTNEIHLKEFINICEKQNGFNAFNECFDKVYYSNILGKRKPCRDAFTTILNENSLNAEETLFIDDSLQHVMGAKEVSMQTIHLPHDKSILDLVEFIKF